MRVLDAISARRERPQPVVARTTRRARPSKAQGIRRKPHGMPELVNAEPPGRD